MKILTDFYSISLPKRILIGIIASIGLAYICTSVLTIIGALLTGLSYNEFIQTTENAVKEVHSPGYILYMLFVQSVTIFLMPAIIMIKVLQVKVFNYWNLQALPSKFFMFIVLQIIVVNIPGMNFWSDINTQFISQFINDSSIFSTMYHHNEKLTHFLLLKSGLDVLLLNLVLMAVIPAICEEFFFRGMLQRYTIRVFKKTGLGIIITASIFSIMHGDIYNFIPRFAMGLIFGYLFEYTRNLWVPIIAHFAHNAFVVIVFYLIQNNIVNPNFEMMGKFGEGIIFGVSSVIFVAVAMTLLINNQSNINLSEENDDLE